MCTWSGAAYLFLDEAQAVEEGPIKIIDPERVPKEPRPLYEGFEWVTMDLTDEKEVGSCETLASEQDTDDIVAGRGLRAIS